MNKLIGLFLVLALVGCSKPEDRGVTITKNPATGRGVLSNVEKQNNGMWQVWIFGDNSYVYCTIDQEVGNKALSIIQETDATVVYTYRDYISTDYEWNTKAYSETSWSMAYWCGQGYSNAHGSKLLTIDRVRR